MTITPTFISSYEPYLKSHNWISQTAKLLACESAGAGNMNVVVRMRTSEGTIIVKQSRPYVAKYEQIAAPIERILVENEFYKKIIDDDFVSAMSPKVLGCDDENFILALEDLGIAADYSSIYKSVDSITTEEIAELVNYLIALHNIPAQPFPENKAMKLLNHEHIFHFPYLENNGFDLDAIQPGLQELSFTVKKNIALKEAITKLGMRYLETGTVLLHGDFYPGSWLKAGAGLKVIDPEFSFVGDAEFDLGVMLAHLKMAGISKNLSLEIINQYQKHHPINSSLLNQYCGTEILRRIIGVAQLPLQHTLAEKKILMEDATALILG